EDPPAPGERTRIGRRTVEIEGRDLGCRVTRRARGVLEDARRAEAGILAAGGPGEVPEMLDLLAARERVDPVANLDPADQREHLVGREIEGVQGQSEGLLADQGEEAVGAVVDPLQEHDVLPAPDLDLHEGRSLPDDPEIEALALELAAVRLDRPG